MRLSLLLISCLLFSAIKLPDKEIHLRKGKDYALLFAVEEYTNMNDLNNPIQNAKDLERELEQNYGFEAELVLNPNQLDIERKIAEYRRKFRQGIFDQKGQLFIFFSGHGIKRGRNGYFVPSDGEPSVIHRTGIEYDWLRSEIDAFACQHILVTIDACHSITFDPDFEDKTDRNFGRNSDLNRDRTLIAHDEYQARLFITSDAVGDQTPDRSSLVREFLRALREHYSPSGYLTHNELFGTYLKSKAFPTPGGGEFGSDDTGSRFLFFRNNNAIDVEAEKTDLTDWRIAQNLDNCNSYRTYLDKHPRGEFVRLARQKLAPCEAEERMLAAWQNARRQNDCAAYEAFSKEYPSSDYASLVPGKLKDLGCNATGGSPPDNMIFVAGGTFQMGDQFGDGHDDEKPVHSVTLSDFYLGTTEVTFAEYDLFCASTSREQANDSGWGRGRRPVINVSWLDAVAYCNWRSKEELLTPVYTISGTNVSANWSANGYRLPSEAEWEYAARSGGRKEKWSGTSSESDLTAYANKSGIEDGYEYTAPVGSFRPNDLGLSDMSGNVWEWCWDWKDSAYYGKSAKRNPKGPSSGFRRVIRGGGWFSGSRSCRAAFRSNRAPESRYNYFGFRLARSF